MLIPFTMILWSVSKEILPPTMLLSLEPLSFIYRSAWVFICSIAILVYRSKLVKSFTHSSCLQTNPLRTLISRIPPSCRGFLLIVTSHIHVSTSSHLWSSSFLYKLLLTWIKIDHSQIEAAAILLILFFQVTLNLLEAGQVLPLMMISFN